jgi:PAS domain S-box-containing protein
MAMEKLIRDSIKTQMIRVGSGHPITSSRVWLEVKDVMSKDVITIASGATVVSAARAMAESSISCLVVVENDSVIGIVTEKDFLTRTPGRGRDLKDIRVADIMSCPLQTIPPNLSVYDASAIMEARHIKRLPVAVAQRLVGMVTQTDLTRALTSYGMWKDVAEIMSRDMVVIRTEATVAEAAEAMNAHNISCIVALDGPTVRGILTERDLLKRVIALQREPAATKVHEVMSSPVRTTPPRYSVFSAYNAMDRLHVRRLVVTEDEQLCGIVTQTDIFRAVKKKLQDEEERNLQVLEHSESGIYTLDLNNRITYVNAAFLRLLEVSDQAELINQPFLPARFWRDPAERTRHLQELHEGNVEIEELALQTSRGRTIHVNLSSTFIQNVHGQISGMQGILHDITARKQSEEALKLAYQKLEGTHRDVQQMQSRLVQQEKLASIGQLAAGVAHEMNTPVGFVASNFETLEGYMKKIRSLLARYEDLEREFATCEDPHLRHLLDDLKRFREEVHIDFLLQDLPALFHDSREGLDRVTTIIQNLRDFSRIDQPGSRDECDLNKGIEATLVVARNEIKYDAEVRTELSELPPVFCHSGQINQVLLNILVNAAQAIRSQKRDQKGTITIRTYPDAGEVVCEIGDDGPGIAPENLSRVFEPFFTTKPPGKGTGLGLSLSYDIVVHKHQGKLLVDSTVGAGTKFTIRLPPGTRENNEQEITSDGEENRVVCGR